MQLEKQNIIAQSRRQTDSLDQAVIAYRDGKGVAPMSLIAQGVQRSLTEQTQERVLFCERCDKKLSADYIHRAIFDVDGGLAYYFCFHYLKGLLNFIPPDLET